MADDAAGARIVNGYARIVKVADVGFAVVDEVYVSRRGKPLDSASYDECVGIDYKDDARVVDHDVTPAVVYGHRLRHVAQVGTVGAAEHTVFHLPLLDIVVRERCVAVHEVAFARDEQTERVVVYRFGLGGAEIHARGRA